MKQTLDITQLELEISELKKLCDSIDPFQSINEDERELLLKHNISNLSDPFAITNSLLLLLENKIEHLNNLGPSSKKVLH